MQSTSDRSVTWRGTANALNLRVGVCQRSDRGWATSIARLDCAGFPVPAFALPSFPIALGQSTKLVLLDRDGREVVWAAAVEIERSRILPWRRIIRLSRFGPGITPEIRDSVVSALVEVAATERALRLHVEVFEPDPETQLVITKALANRGFEAAPYSRSYASTVFIDLRGTDDQILASFHSTARRHIRALAKHQLQCHPITDPALSARMNELLGVSMSRTGALFEETRWVEVLAFIAAHPSRAALLGVFRTDMVGAEALVGYVLGYRHGDTVEYSIAACARLVEIRAPLLYAPTWELMRWGKRNGARWFDFGGITAGSRASGDPAGGISDFKRYFFARETTLGGEMIFSPVPRLSRLAAAMSAMMSRRPRF